ncbi:MAG: hypothetical protein JNG85_02765 [Spirochaetaceae bacterium]|nr:hypothetical protein [Spirochaetaceae bacterium]
MKKPSPPRRAALVAACAALIGGTAAPSLFAATYEELRAAAAARDTELPLLAAAEESAEIAYRRAQASRGAPKIEVSLGAASLAFGSASGAALSAAPQAGIAFPGGAALSAKSPLSVGAGAASASPSLGGSLPLLRGPDPGLAQTEELAAALRAARRAKEARSLALELELVRGLKETAAAEAALQAALRLEAKARNALERARRVDGAAPGGTVALSLERELRAAEGARRKAESARRRAGEEVEERCGFAPGADLLAAEPPAGELGLPFPRAEDLEEAVAAREAAAAAMILREESRRRVELAATLDAAAPELVAGSPSAAAPAGASILGGFALEFEGVKAGASLGWEFASPHAAAGAQGGPRLDLRLSWTSRPPGETARILREAELALEAAEARTRRALQEARAKLRRLEREREDLLSRGRAAAEELSFATEELALYAAWRERGVVGEAEYAEVLAALEGARAEFRSLAYDRLAWSLELRLLAGPCAGADAPASKE